MKRPLLRLGLPILGAAVLVIALLVARSGPRPITAQTVPLASGRVAGIVDCNGNGVDDAADLAAGTSLDCNGNDRPDECDSFPTTTLSAIQVAGGLILPIDVTAPPGDTDRLFIVEKNGRVRILDLGSGVLLSPPFLAIEDHVDNGEEGGLLGLAFPAHYAVSGQFYLHYSEAFTGDTVIARWSVGTDPNRADPDSEVVLRVIPQDSASHNGSPIRFGPDGLLYLPLGDGGVAFDAFNRAQDPQSLLGKVLRLDVDNPPTYVPALNPFVGDPSTADEVWALGLRNPFSMCFDRLTGDLYLADVGGAEREEIDFEPAGSPGGRNYGWKCTEGTTCTTLGGCTCPNAGHTAPIHEVLHGTGDNTCAIVGGVVYRGCAMPDYSGRYFYGDFCGNWIRSLRVVEDGQGGHVATDVVDHTADLNPGGAWSSIVRLGEDGAGEIYFATFFTGTLWKIVPEGAGAAACGNFVVEPGEECEPPATANCDCQCNLVPCDTVVLADDFETDAGWTVSGALAPGAGRWQRGTPLDCQQGDPASDADGSGQCWLTGNSTCADVDGTDTVLTSPVLDLSGGAVISFRYWVNDEAANPMSEFDGMTVEIAVDPAGTSWQTVREYSTTAGSWRADAIEIGEETAATSTVRVRFVAFDRFADDTVEAAIDAVQVCAGPGQGGLDCNDNGVADHCEIVEGLEADCDDDRVPDSCQLADGSAQDCNGNGVPDACDIALGTSTDADLDGVPDECRIEPDVNGDGVVDVYDLVMVILGWGPCPGPPATCTGDVDGTGAVDINDLVAVFTAMGG